MIIIYVCHDQRSVDICIEKTPSAYIFLVGPNLVTSKYPERLIIARDLSNNIEHERKLLTFTAWYAIVKNNLFPEETHLCILEWDVTVPPVSDIQEDIGILFEDPGHHIYTDVNRSVIQAYILSKGILHFLSGKWPCTTNYILSKRVLAEFVNFYYPSYTYIKERDPRRLSWYHERVFATFIKHKKYSSKFIPGAIHIQANSHIEINR
jgi:hypothetical protein